MAKKPKEIMTKEENEAWGNLYQYVKTNVMGYDENQALPKKYCCRLKGMRHGKFYENRSTKDYANYSYDAILNAFKYSMPDIQYAIRNVRFVDEEHKFNYIMKIVEKNLNDIYIRMKRVEKANKEIEDSDMSYAQNYASRFVHKEVKNNNRLNDLW